MAAKTPPTPKTTPLLDQLAEHGERLSAARQRGRELAQAIADQQQQIEQHRIARVAAYGAGDEATASRLRKESFELEAEAGELALRREGAGVAVREAERERDVFIGENHGALVAEREPLGRAAVQSITDAIGELAQGVKAWEAESRIQIELLRPIPNLDGRDLPDLHIAQFVRDLRRAAEGGIPMPVPRPRPAPPAPVPVDAGGGVTFEAIG